MNRRPATPRRQLSIRVIDGHERGRALFDHLLDRGIIGDWCEPEAIPLCPAPIYNWFADCLAFAEAVRVWSRDG